MVLQKPAEIQTLVVRLFTACGVPVRSAEVVAEHLVTAEMMGFPSHGVQRVKQYVEDLRKGWIRSEAEATITRETPTTAVLDGNWQWGQVAGLQGVDKVLEKAREYGTGSVLVHRCRHFGRVGAYTEKVAAQDCLAIAGCSAGREGHWVAPFGGRQGRLGTNPISFAAPTSGAPLLMDFSTASIPEGKVRFFRDTGRTLPEPWVVNTAGYPSRDPQDLYNDEELPAGAILPFGGEQGYKGYGLSLMVQTLCGVLGAPVWRLEGIEAGQNVLWILAVQVEAFTEPETFRAEISAMTDYVRSAARDVGTERILLPGQREFELREERKRSGIPLADEIWNQLMDLAEELGITC